MKLPLADTLAAVSSRAAKVLGIQAGTLAPGTAADVCLFDAARPWIVSPSALASQGKNSPFLGLEMTGRVVATHDARIKKYFQKTITLGGVQ